MKHFSFIAFLLLSTPLFAQYYPVPMNGKTGYINEEGAFAFPTSFLHGKAFSEGLAAVTIMPDTVFQKWYYVDTSLQIKIKRGAGNAQPFHEGLAAVKSYHGWNFIDTEGRIAIKGDYDSVSNFSKGYARVKQNGFWGLIDTSGVIVLQAEYQSLSEYTSHVIAARHKHDTITYILSLEGDTLFGKGFQDAKALVNGRALIKSVDVWQYLDATGKKLLSVYVDDARPFYGSLAAVQERGHWYFMDKKGDIDKSQELTYPVDLREKLNWVEFTDGTSGYMNQNGQWVYKVSEP